MTVDNILSELLLGGAGDRRQIGAVRMRGRFGTVPVHTAADGGQLVVMPVIAIQNPAASRWS